MNEIESLKAQVKQLQAEKRAMLDKIIDLRIERDGLADDVAELESQLEAIELGM